MLPEAEAEILTEAEDAPGKAAEKPSKSNLGRGLAALFGDSGPIAPDPAGEAESRRQPRAVPLEHLHPNPNQPRRRFEEETLEQLTRSIRENGLLQPILVRPHPKHAGEFEIVAGERRWRAAQRAQLHEAPVTIRDLSDVKSLEIALLENIQREDLNPVEEAEGFHRLMEEFDYTQENLAQALGKSRSHIANTLRLLNLKGVARELLIEGKLTAGHARALLVAEDPSALARKVVKDGLSVRQTEDLAQGQKSADSGKGGRKKSKKSDAFDSSLLGKDADTLALERDLAEVLGLKVSIDFQRDDSETGSITVHYENLEQLDDLVRRLNQTPAD